MRLVTRTRGDAGFTLVELLVVLLILGILAGIALMSLTKHTAKAQDAEAKSNARSIVSVVEACNAAEDDYRNCESDDVPGIRNTGIALGGGPGKVVVTSTARRSFTVTSLSRSGNVFVMTRTDGAGVVRTCEVRGDEDGGCSGGSW
ncbi:MAG TPA: prepilin-type N-terminal cleavage/methylation domain-containing protein [Solirubrobacteraceae bacterium]|nr:prepilin-type N-terminal cleavage/methylation domain-containing protein [Solirubrobacteraceae bacterium]